MYLIKRNKKTNTEAGVLVKERPAIPAPEYRYETIDIPGRDGKLYSEEELMTLQSRSHSYLQLISQNGKTFFARRGDGYSIKRTTS